MVVLLWMPLDLSVGLDTVEGLVDRPALPAAARHIRRTKVRMSVNPRDSRPAARLQLEPLWKWTAKPLVQKKKTDRTFSLGSII